MEQSGNYLPIAWDLARMLYLWLYTFKWGMSPSRPLPGPLHVSWYHYGDVIMDAIASQITSLTIIYSIVYSDADQRKHQSSASLAFVRGIHRRPVNSPHKWPVTRKTFPFDDVIMCCGWVSATHDDVSKWNYFPRHWPFVRGIHRAPVNSPHKGQWRGALMFSLICAWIKY